MTSFKELRDSKIGTTMWYLTAVAYIGGRRGYFEFNCTCGNKVKAPWARVKAGDIKSCGCWRKGRPVSDDPYVPHRTVYHRYRLSAKKRNLEFLLSEEELRKLIVKQCTYCGDVPSTDMKLSAHPEFRYTGIDRVDNDLGYITTNVVPCCTICNRAKLNMKHQDWLAWLARVKEFKGT